MMDSFCYWAPTIAIIATLPGCIFGSGGGGVDRPPPLPARCVSADTTWNPERIELLGMADRTLVSEGSYVQLVSGAQGSSMVGFYVVVYGADIPPCLFTNISFGVREPQSGNWEYQSDDAGRAEIENPAYWIEDGAGTTGVEVSAQVGATSVTYVVDYGY